MYISSSQLDLAAQLVQSHTSKLKLAGSNFSRGQVEFYLFAQYHFLAGIAPTVLSLILTGLPASRSSYSDNNYI